MTRTSSFYNELCYCECLQGRGEANGRGAGILGIRVRFLFWGFWNHGGPDLIGSISFVVPELW
jgi:hypothetical protein